VPPIKDDKMPGDWQNESALLGFAKVGEGVAYVQASKDHPFIIVASADAELTKELRQVIAAWEKVQDMEVEDE
jgi:hypothetical protein